MSTPPSPSEWRATVIVWLFFSMVVLASLVTIFNLGKILLNLLGVLHG